MASYNNIVGLANVIEKMESSLRVLCEAHNEHVGNQGALFNDITMDDNSHCTLTVNSGDWIFRIFRNGQILLKIAFGSASVKSNAMRFYPTMIYSNGESDSKVVVIGPETGKGTFFDIPLKEDIYFQKSLVTELPDAHAVISICKIMGGFDLKGTSSFSAQVYEPNFTYNRVDDLNVACVSMIQAIKNDITPKSS